MMGKNMAPAAVFEMNSVMKVATKQTAAKNTKSVRHFVNNRMVNMVNTVTMVIQALCQNLRT